MNIDQIGWLNDVHIACAILSGTGYLIRGIGMMRESSWLHNTWVRVLPHIVDTILLASAILLTIQIRQYPFVQGWLTAKVLALVAYIVIGAVGLKYGKTMKIRVMAWLVAMLLFGYIVLVALTRQVLPYIG
ncbi:MAG: SirB2 family protein [Sulfuricaulis sp.]|nr:SirB2 family protein [Sulfuricaulis sp.]